MANYIFETITDAQALAWTAADTLIFTTPGESGRLTTIRFNPATATSDATVTVVSGITGRTVTFSTAFFDETPIFPDGSVVVVGNVGQDSDAGTAGADALYGYSGDDSLVGANGTDLLQGNAGNDTLVGGSGGDTVYGGQGNDTIDVGVGSNFAQGNLGNDSIVATGADSSTAQTLLGGQGNEIGRAHVCTPVNTA